MSQRRVNVNEEMVVNLQLKVNLKSFSNHNGFKEGQVDKAIEEFKEVIVEELYSIIENDYQQKEFLYSTDLVDFEVIPNI